MRDEGQERDKLFCTSGTQSVVLEPARISTAWELVRNTHPRAQSPDLMNQELWGDAQGSVSAQALQVILIRCMFKIAP